MKLLAIAIWRTSRPGRRRFEEESERLEPHASNINAPLLIVSEFRSFDALLYPFPTIVLPLVSFHLVTLSWYSFFSALLGRLFTVSIPRSWDESVRGFFLFLLLILSRARLCGAAF